MAEFRIYQYFMTYPRDRRFNKASVFVALSSDFTTVFACLSANYLYLVTLYLLTHTSISSGVVQFWLARMVFNLTKQWIWIPTITVFFFAGLTGAVATAGLLVIDSSSAARGQFVK
ncbi:hypothetical protein C8R44DRAFT_749640 [Mycena epipterygia]|nr:hypothetical protein C8R44DRAFT_749640 [Mycena epipterygia]